MLIIGRSTLQSYVSRRARNTRATTRYCCIALTACYFQNFTLLTFHVCSAPYNLSLPPADAVIDLCRWVLRWQPGEADRPYLSWRPCGICTRHYGRLCGDGSSEHQLRCSRLGDGAVWCLDAKYCPLEAVSAILTALISLRTGVHPIGMRYSRRVRYRSRRRRELVFYRPADTALSTSADAPYRGMRSVLHFAGVGWPLRRDIKFDMAA